MVGLRWSHNAFFSRPIEVIFPNFTIKLMGEREREQAWRTPKFLNGLNYESKGEDNGRRRSWGALPGS
jgi:hypothetical protein